MQRLTYGEHHMDSRHPRDLNGIPRPAPLDTRGSEHIRDLQGVSPVTTSSTPVTPDEPEASEASKRPWVPKRELPCHGQSKQRLGFVVRSTGEEVALEKSCPACRRALAQSAEEFAWASKDLERQATEFLKRRRVKLDRRGNLRSPRTPEGP